MRAGSTYKIQDGMNANNLAVQSNPLSLYSAYTMSNILTPANIQQWTSVTDKAIYE